MHPDALIEAVPGLCAGLVDGEVDPDRWISAREAVWMATQAGAMVLGLPEKLGKVQPGYLADLIPVRLGGAFFYTRRLFQQHRSWRAFEDKSKRAVREYADLSRDNLPWAVRGTGVVFFAERHQIDPMACQGRADRRRRVCFPCFDLQAHDCF